MENTENIKEPTEEITEAPKAEEKTSHEKKPKKASEKDTLKSEIEELNKKLSAEKDKLLRIAAEYDNYRKRTEREKLQSASHGSASAIEKLLPAIDTLEIAAAAESADAEYKKGVELTVELFKKALEGLGVTEMEALGKPFDPNVHAAVMREAVEDTESGTVIKVLQKGYMIGDRVLRFAMVSVAE